MKPLKIIYNVLKQIRKDGKVPDGIDKDVWRALIQLGLIENPWDFELTEDGGKMLNWLIDIYEKY